MFFYFVSFVIVALGQPAWWPLMGPLAAAFGYAMLWKALLDIDTAKNRFWLGVLWFAAVQLVQLSWLVSHPYIYIYGVYFLLAFLLGCQFGCLCYFITRENLKKNLSFLALASLWTLFEWSRLYLFAGYTWNPVGLSLTTNLYALQGASLMGIYGLSFWVILTNLFVLKAWVDNNPPSLRKTAAGKIPDEFRKVADIKGVVVAIVLAAAPYLFGAFQVHEEKGHLATSPKLPVLLVQTAFPIEEMLPLKPENLRQYAFQEWVQILKILKEHQGEKPHLIVLPEIVVPYGTYAPVFSFLDTKKVFQELFGEEVKLPPLTTPVASQIHGVWQITNSFFVQAIADLFQAEVIVGLEDASRMENNEIEYYNAALFFQPHTLGDELRYEKRVLLPMGEYIPFDFLRDLALKYGVGGSFTCGKTAKVFQGKTASFGLNICYEETFSHLMRDNKLLGADLLVNLTSDVWYPDSKLPEQHCDHARVRTVENGIPLIRACNTGVTCGIDCLGRMIAQWGDHTGPHEWLAGALFLEVPLHHYSTLYSYTGDYLIIALSFLFVGFYLLKSKLRIH